MKFEPKALEETADISSGYTGWRDNLKNCLVIVCLFYAAYMLLGLAAEWFASTLTDQQEVNYFSALDIAERVGKAIPDADKDQFDRAQRILNRLLATERGRDLPYALFMMDAPQPNAVAVVGGSIGMTSSLLNKVTSDQGLAMVLAHELGHHQFRHPIRLFSRSMLITVAVSMLSLDSSVGVMNTTLSALEAGYSRVQERQADEYALKLVQATYGHTEDALEFFELIHQQYENGDSSFSTFFSTHPPTKDRIEYLTQLQKTLGN